MSYEVQTHDIAGRPGAGRSITGTVPVREMVALMGLWEKDGLVLAAGAASALGASFAACKAADVEAWEQELRAAAGVRASGDAELAWLYGPDTGISSLTIFATLCKRKHAGAARARLGAWGADVPADPADLGRCLRLLEAFPGWRDRMDRVASTYPKWGPLVREWDRLAAMYAEELPSGRAPKTYERMQELHAESGRR